MDAPTEKVYVAIGNDLQDGRKTLEWTIRKWMSHPISIVILHVTYDISMEFVYTPFGKLPASVVSEEKLEVLRRYEQAKIDKLLSDFVNYCGKVKAEIFKVEKTDEPMQKHTLTQAGGRRHKVLGGHEVAGPTKVSKCEDDRMWGRPRS